MSPVARPPEGGAARIDGLLLLDKPVGMTSNRALQQARRLLGADKAGHGGTLDPAADGLLPLLFGEACKLAGAALEGDKAYEALVALGATTTTDDAEGEVITTRPVAVDDGAIEAALARLRGPISQVPPVYSALKVDGRPLYRLARAGTPVTPAARPVTIHALDRLPPLPGDPPTRLRLAVACSKGTYIRSLARDLGEMLGCGAHLAGLRRTTVGRFRVADAIGLDALAALELPARLGRLVPPSALVADRAMVAIDVAAAARFGQGQPVAIEPMPPATAERAEAGFVVTCGGHLIGLARLEHSSGASPRLWPVRVFTSPLP